MEEVCIEVDEHDISKGPVTKRQGKVDVNRLFVKILADCNCDVSICTMFFFFSYIFSCFSSAFDDGNQKGFASPSFQHIPVQ